MKQLLGGGTLVWLLLTPGCVRCPEEFTAGVLIPTASKMEVLAQGNGRLYSMYGAERITRADLRDIALLHVLILAPDDEVRGGGNGMQTRCLQATETFTWQMGNWKTGPFDLADQRLELHYDGQRKLLTVGTTSLPTNESNCFIVRLDRNWRPTLSRIHLLVPERLELRDLIERIRQAETASPDARDVRLYSEVTREGER